MKSHEESKRQNGQKRGEKNGPSRSSTNYALTDPFVGIPSFFPPKRGDQPAILPVVRPAVFLVFENDRDGSFVRLGGGRSHLHPLATVTWKRVPKSGRIANHQGWNRLFAQSWWTAFFSKGERNEFPSLKFLRAFAHPGVVNLSSWRSRCF